MNEQSGFLRAICENPWCDVARLAYADWLKDNDEPAGKERGEFIRYRCSDPFAVGSPEDPEIAIVTPYEEWPDSPWSLFELSGDNMRSIFWSWRRGFIDSLELPIKEFYPRAKRLFQAHPIERVEITGQIPRCQGPRTFEWWTQDRGTLPWLEASGYFIPLAICRHLRGFRERKTRPKGRQLFRRQGAQQFAYQSEQAAKDDLNAACCRYGRFLAGLPQLAEVAVEG